jgi:hypothetical protein
MGISTSAPDMQELIAALNEFTETCKSLPVIDIGTRRGGTDYIDFLTHTDVTTSSRGTDCYGRPFVALTGTMHFKDGSSNEFLETFFQRYSDGTTLWMGCGWTKTFMSSVGGITAEQFKLLTRLVKEKSVDITEHVDGLDLDCVRLELK